MVNKFADKKWTKIWTTEYSLFSVWLFGREYIEDCRKEVGFGFDDIVFQVQGDLATVFRDNIKQAEFVKYLSEKTLKDKNYRDHCLSTYFDLNNKLLSFVEKSAEEILNLTDIQKFIDLHRRFIAYFLVPLWSPNGFDSVDCDAVIKQEVFKQFESARKETEHTYPKIEKFLQRIFEYISKKEGVEAKLLRSILPEELITFIKTNKLPSVRDLQSRYEFSAILCNLDSNTLITGVEGRNLIDKISNIENIDANEFKGQIANKGVVSGKVRKVFLEKDMNNFQSGEILVTTMTRPEWLPIMKIAGAFVTDAGGILSHAAIVSRELNKPCVIGTKIATQVLKDGDMVEVDADNGVVRIIK